MLTARAIKYLREPRAIRLLGRLRKTQYLSAEEIRAYQWGKLKRLLAHAYAHVPYYRRVMQSCGARPADIRSLDDFRKLPVLTKQIIRDNIEDLIATNVPRRSLRLNATGGSTGEPLQYYQDRSFARWASAARLRGWYEFPGCAPGSCCAVIWGATHEIKEDYSVLERIRDLWVLGEVRLNAFNLSDDRKREFLDRCLRLRPKLLRGYFTAIKELAEFLISNGLRFSPLIGVVLCAETVDAESQALIERAFAAPSYNSYGGREVSLMAMECSEKSGLHEVSENNYLELEQVEVEGYENIGNVVVTNLNNHGMPFVRYRIGDLALAGATERCACGRGLPRIARVIGRSTDVFQFADGTKIAGEMFIHLMKDFPLKRYQFALVSGEAVALRVERTDPLTPELRSRIRERYSKYLPEGVALVFEEVEQLDRTPTGKFRFVVVETEN